MTKRRALRATLMQNLSLRRNGAPAVRVATIGWWSQTSARHRIASTRKQPATGGPAGRAGKRCILIASTPLLQEHGRVRRSVALWRLIMRGKPHLKSPRLSDAGNHRPTACSGCPETTLLSMRMFFQKNDGPRCNDVPGGAEMEQPHSLGPLSIRPCRHSAVRCGSEQRPQALLFTPNKSRWAYSIRSFFDRRLAKMKLPSERAAMEITCRPIRSPAPYPQPKYRSSSNCVRYNEQYGVVL